MTKHFSRWSAVGTATLSSTSGESLRARFQTLIPHPSIQPTVAEEDPHALFLMSYKGHRLFNSLLQNIRNLNECVVTTFKEALDKFLQTLPNQPLLPSLTQLGVCDTNSVDDWVSRWSHRTSPPRKFTGHKDIHPTMAFWCHQESTPKVPKVRKRVFQRDPKWITLT